MSDKSQKSMDEDVRENKEMYQALADDDEEDEELFDGEHATVGDSVVKE